MHCFQPQSTSTTRHDTECDLSVKPFFQLQSNMSTMCFRPQSVGIFFQGWHDHCDGFDFPRNCELPDSPPMQGCMAAVLGEQNKRARTKQRGVSRYCVLANSLTNMHRMHSERASVNQVACSSRTLNSICRQNHLLS